MSDLPAAYGQACWLLAGGDLPQRPGLVALDDQLDALVREEANPVDTALRAVVGSLLLARRAVDDGSFDDADAEVIGACRRILAATLGHGNVSSPGVG